GLTRLFYGKFGQKINLERFITLSSVLAVFSYLLIGLTNAPIFGFIGCSLSGMAVGILWPGVFSLASRMIRNGGTAMFAYLALAGDLGCSLGPTVVGFVSKTAGNQLKFGILGAAIFPILMTLFSLLIQKVTPSHGNRLIDTYH